MRDMECPHCVQGFHPSFVSFRLETKVEKRENDCILYYDICPQCGKYIIYNTFVEKNGSYFSGTDPTSIENLTRMFPRNKNHK